MTKTGTKPVHSVMAGAALLASFVLTLPASAFDGERALNESELRQLFSAFDDNSDALVTRGEFATVVSSVRVEMSADEVVSMFASYDSDQSGDLRYDEFVAFMGGFQRTDDATARRMEHVFLQFDANRDGGLDASEIMALMQDGGRPLSLRDAKSIVFEADQDGNGRIDTAEFAGLGG